MASILELTREDFMAALPELAQQGVDTNNLLRAYNAQNDATAGLQGYLGAPSQGIEDSGRSRTLGGLLSYDPSAASGMDRIRSMGLEPRAAAQDAISGLLGAGQNVYNAVSGRLPAEDMQGAAFDAASLLMGGGAASAGRGLLDYDPNTTRMFLGPSAANADLGALEKARQLSASRRSPDEIWNETGWFKGADGKWRFEIDDTGLGFKSDGLSKFKKDPVGRYTLVDDMVRHDDLFAAYPSLQRGQHSIQKGDGWNEGSWNGADFSVASRPKEDMRGILGHEFQHYVQGREGFAGGGSPSRFTDITPPELIPARDAMRAEFMSLPGGSPERIAKVEEYHSLFDRFTPEGQYKRLAGETESRNVTKRLNMTPAERIETPPWMTQDFPDSEQILQFDATSARSAAAIPSLPAPRNAAEAAAKDILDLRGAGRASEVTDEMMAAADPEYMYFNTPLPMDEASRMARAEAAGRGRVMYHGGKGGYTEFDPDMADGKGYDAGTWLSDDADIAATYAGGVFDNASTYPVVADTKNFGSVDWRGKSWGDGDPYAYIINPRGSDNFSDKLSTIYEDWRSWPSSDNAARAANYSGMSGVELKNIVDVGPNIFSRADRGKPLPETSTSFAVFDPSATRSRFARFDPEFAHLRNLSAGVGGAGLLSMGYPQEEQY